MLGTTILEERKSKFNGIIKVVKTWGMGTYIQASGLTQSGGIVESIWKSTLSQIPNSRFKIHDVLILGLGGGTLAKLLRKKYPEAKITGVDIDPVMVELGTKHLGLDTSKTKVVIQDAFDYCLLPNAYDLVVVDLYQGDKFIDLEKFNFKNAELVIFNRLYYKNKKQEALKFGEKLKKFFKKVDYYYPEANIMFICYNK